MTGTEQQIFTITRVFDAPRQLLFACFSEARHMQHWWGPKGVEIVNATMDFRVGGIYHYGMKWPTGAIMWGRFVFREIVPPSRIVFLNSFSDEKAGLTRAPFFDGKWPLEMLTVFSFADQGGSKTRFTMTWQPHNAPAEEQAVFAANHASAAAGWDGTMEKLEAYLASIKQA
jgi:uncharacterized protein YndB with AHSA1/START domain